MGLLPGDHRGASTSQDVEHVQLEEILHMDDASAEQRHPIRPPETQLGEVHVTGTWCRGPNGLTIHNKHLDKELMLNEEKYKYISEVERGILFILTGKAPSKPITKG
ncbi:hypothetical protein BHE74_00020290 [Ensete ventricosum]|nr:hypothetical protein BHE74_00020290 [Ensete ventricosum]